jgi:hypothetical protein
MLQLSPGGEEIGALHRQLREAKSGQGEREDPNEDAAASEEAMDVEEKSAGEGKGGNDEKEEEDDDDDANDPMHES